jgi:hypothetical protein
VDISSQPAAGVVRSDSIWEMSVEAIMTDTQRGRWRTLLGEPSLFMKRVTR